MQRRDFLTAIAVGAMVALTLGQDLPKTTLEPCGSPGSRVQLIGFMWQGRMMVVRVLGNAFLLQVLWGRVERSVILKLALCLVDG